MADSSTVGGDSQAVLQHLVVLDMLTNKQTNKTLMQDGHAEGHQSHLNELLTAQAGKI